MSSFVHNAYTARFLLRFENSMLWVNPRDSAQLYKTICTMAACVYVRTLIGSMLEKDLHRELFAFTYTHTMPFFISLRMCTSTWPWLVPRVASFVLWICFTDNLARVGCQSKDQSTTSMRRPGYDDATAGTRRAAGRRTHRLANVRTSTRMHILRAQARQASRFFLSGILLHARTLEPSRGACGGDPLAHPRGAQLPIPHAPPHH